jgi:3-hydroxyacyl-CoA dehydrogenase/3a,7a,12a-trihydroxy-5b-cholest-24-enoyl-CoA hydratase
MPSSVRDFFDQRVPDALRQHPERAKEVAATFLFAINGPDGGTWTADLISSPPICQPGCVGQAQCTIEVTDEDFRSMIDGGAQVAVQVFLSGKLRIGGDPMLISRLLRLLQMGNAPMI